jgi:hypothetical protein
MVNANSEPVPLTRVPKKRELKSMSMKEAFARDNCIHCKASVYVVELTKVRQAGTDDIVSVCQQCFQRLLQK